MKGNSMPILHYFHTAVVSGYLTKEQWQLWADERIMNNDDLEKWIYDISVAEDASEFSCAIGYYKLLEAIDENDFYWEPDVVIGYYYIMCKEGRMSLTELFNKLADEDDECGEAAFVFKPEAQSMLHKAELGEIDSEEIDKLLMPLAQIATKQLAALKKYMEMQ